VIKGALSNNRADRTQRVIPLKEVGLVFLSLLVFLCGCTYIPQKNFDCGDWNEAKDTWFCQSRVTGKCIKNTYVEPEQCSSIPKGETNE